jgi:hypothetical protein
MVEEDFDDEYELSKRRVNQSQEKKSISDLNSAVSCISRHSRGSMGRMSNTPSLNQLC